MRFTPWSVCNGACKNGALLALLEGEAGPGPDELARTREMLNSRYDDLKSGRVKPISRDEVIAHFRGKSAAARRTPRNS